MNHLGLRIYRFYIKCTACLSEISFRTDPANTDYVLEAGATRNFEALSKAEKQAELDEKAYQEEIKLNPMKLLEERTEASKNEMERMEALEELHELNKRNLKNELPDAMISKLNEMQKVVEQKEDEAEKQDEEFVMSVFGKDSNNQKIKRIVEDSDEDDDQSQAPRKQPKIDKPTDILSNRTIDKEKKNDWEKSIGGLSKKSTLKGMIVKKKASIEPKPCGVNNLKVPITKLNTNVCEDTLQNSNNAAATISSNSKLEPKSADASSNGLGSLGMINYSDSDDESDD